MQSYRPAWVEVNLDSIAHNVQKIKERVGQAVCIMATVKGDGYGHGAYEVASTALRNGAGKLAVAMVDEGIELRKAGIKAPILILGMSMPEHAPEIVHYDLMQAVCDDQLPAALAREAARQGRMAQVNIKVNTGMNRIGIRPEQAVSYAQSLLARPELEVEGIFTHFASSYYEREFVQQQFERFRQAIDSLAMAGINIPYRHCCNSGAVLNFPHMYLNQVRPGTIITTATPAQTPEMNLDLRTAMGIKTKIAFIHPLPAGESMGYNLIYTAETDRQIAVIPIGWADGLPADLANKGEVLIRGKRCPIRGRICMDQTMVDITDVPAAAVGDEVVIIGRQGEDEIQANEWTTAVGGMNSHVSLRCLITKRMPRIYLKEGEAVGLRTTLRPDLTQMVAQ
ncbi:MAG: alanine racemase [bacterium]|jgi:alanine racemase